MKSDKRPNDLGAFQDILYPHSRIKRYTLLTP